jgi:thiamine-phosphate pyrophosphorylase
MTYDIKKIYRICDANLNRAKEGLRVVEEYIRFYIEDEKMLKDIRDVRHKISEISKEIYPKILIERNVVLDHGAKIIEKKRDDLKSVITANFKRVQEALRVLEEFSKLPEISDEAHAFKNLRFKVYELEQQLFLKEKI